jgi:hypothetical protein
VAELRQSALTLHCFMKRCHKGTEGSELRHEIVEACAPSTPSCISRRMTSLASCPTNFREGMAARADRLRDLVSCSAGTLGSEPPRATTSSSYPTSSWGLGRSSPCLGPVVV